MSKEIQGHMTDQDKGIGGFLSNVHLNQVQDPSVGEWVPHIQSSKFKVQVDYTRLTSV